MTGYCSSLELPISRASLRKFITRPSLCNNIQYITGVQHASPATNGEMIVLRVVPSPRSLRSLGVKTFSRNKKSVTQNDAKDFARIFAETSMCKYSTKGRL